VVTPALRLWHTYRTLEFVYRDAYHSQLNDRYAAKRDQFRELSRWAYDRVIQSGVGIALSPVPQAASVTLTPVPGGLADGMYYAAMAWVNTAGDEGACSTPAAIDVVGGGFVVEAGPAPSGVVGWNVYAGAAPDTLARQASLAVGESWTAAAISESGARPGAGQSASLMHAIPRVLQRG
jgi:hypothetical protein